MTTDNHHEGDAPATRRDDDLDVVSDSYGPLRSSEVLRIIEVPALAPPVPNPPTLPLREIDPEAFERLAAEIVYRNLGNSVQFYGRRGQKQYGLDIVERRTARDHTLYQVRRYETLTPAQMRRSVVDYAGSPRPADYGGEPRRFDPRRFVLITSARTENDTALVDELAALRAEYAGDLEIDVWGAEALGRRLRDAPHTIASVFGTVWAAGWCGIATSSDPQEPKPFGLVEDPVDVLNLGHMVADANAALASDPQRAARFFDALAQALLDAGFPSHARSMRVRQSDALRLAGCVADAFDVLSNIAVAQVMAASEYSRSPIKRGLEAMKSDLSSTQVSKVDTLARLDNWYDHGPD